MSDPAPQPSTSAAPVAAPPADSTTEDQPMPDAPQAPESFEVIYVQNLNERIKIPIMKQSLKVLFKQYSTVLDVTAHKNVRMRGQAFVTLKSKEAAALAVKEVQGFPLYGKPVVLAFAKTRSDALVKRKTPDEMEDHKKERAERKKVSRRDNPIRRKQLAKKLAAANSTAPLSTAPGAPATAAPPTAPRKMVEMPDEYLPPNKILFVQDLPADTTKDSLEALFRPYAGLSEVRTIPGRATIAFVEFENAELSGVAKEALHRQGELNLKVTFAKA